MVARSRSLLAVKPSSVPPLLVNTNSAPPASLSVPFLIVPPTRFQEPVVAVRARVLLVLSSVPVRFTVPPERLKVPKPAVVKLPPRFTVEVLSVIVPVLLQTPEPEPRFSVAPVPVIVDVLLQVPPSDSVVPVGAVSPRLLTQLAPAKINWLPGPVTLAAFRLPVSPLTLSVSPLATCSVPWLVKVL